MADGFTILFCQSCIILLVVHCGNPERKASSYPLFKEGKRSAGRLSPVHGGGVGVVEKTFLRIAWQARVNELK